MSVAGDDAPSNWFNVTWGVIFTYTVFSPSLIPKYVPLRFNVCFNPVSDSVLLSPIDPSLKLEHKNIFGYAVNCAPSAFRGTAPYVFVIL